MASGEPSILAGSDDDRPDFVKVDQKYVCVSCDRVLRPPVKQTECGHRLCGSCADNILQSSSRMCPGNEDGCVELAPDKVYPDFGTARDVKNMLVFCPNKSLHCKAEVAWKDLEKHKVECPYRPVLCPNREFGCSEAVSVKDFDEHQQNCPFKPEICDYCQKQIPKKEMQAGHKEKCREQERLCSYFEHGCTVKARSDKLLKHETEQIRFHLQLVKDSLEKANMKTQRLESELEVKTARITSLEKTVEDLKQDTATKVQALDNKFKQGQKSIAMNSERLVKLEERPAVGVSGAPVGALPQDVKNLQELSRIQENRINKLEVTQSQRGPGGGPTNITDDSRQKINQLEESYGLHDVRLAEFDLRFQCLETTNYDGTLLWKIRDYRRRKEDAVAGRVLSLYSQPFYSSKFGYKMCARVYLNGDGMGKGTHMSLFFVVMKGDFDALMPWPFRQKVTLTLLDQENGRRHLSDTFKPDPTSTSFRKPVTEMNVASGCPLFVAQSVLESKTYMQEDTIYLKIAVDTADLVVP